MHSIEALRNIFTAYLKQEAFTQEPINLYEPNNYFLQIGGKRLRPTLLLLSTELFGGNITNALPAALAIEYFHNFTLIHDDIMDNAPVRRGFKTIHEKYSLNTAILSGDLLMIKAYQYISKVEAAYFKAIFEVYTETAIEVCEGQQYDIDFESKHEVTHDEYIKMIRLKTSVLLAASMKIGAILGGASKDDADLLYSYAENLGIAFQIQDDILDCYGDEDLVGKQPGGDIIQNKKTLLLIELLKRSEAKNDRRIKDLMKQNNSSKVSKTISLLEEYQIKDFALAHRDAYVQKSLSALDKIHLPDDKKNILNSLVEHLVLRAF